MKLPGPHIPVRHLKPGELLITRDASWITTVLGSCVSVTMFNPRLRIAGICHGMLPEPHGRSRRHAEQEPFRFLCFVVPEMTQAMQRFGIPPEEVEVKMFGGANLIDIGGDPHDDRSIGDSNVTMARKLLVAACYKIKAQRVGGDCGCKIVFNTSTGEVLYKPLTRGRRASA